MRLSPHRPSWPSCPLRHTGEDGGWGLHVLPDGPPWLTPGSLMLVDHSRPLAAFVFPSGCLHSGKRLAGHLLSLMASPLAFLRIPSLTPPPDNKHVPWLFLSGWKGPGSRGCTLPRWRSVPRLFSASQDVLFAFPPLLPGSASDGGWKEIRRVDFSPHLSELSEPVLNPRLARGRVWRLGPCELLSQPGPQSERGGESQRKEPRCELAEPAGRGRRGLRAAETQSSVRGGAGSFFAQVARCAYLHGDGPLEGSAAGQREAG